MKYISIILLAVLSLTAINACKSKSPSKKATIVKESDIVKKSIGVDGMTCVGCEVTLEQSISKIKGVVSVKASHTNKEAVIEFDSTKTDIQTISNKVKELGFKVINQ